MKSYGTEYATAARSSRVAVRSRPLASLSRVAAPSAPPVIITLNTTADHLGVIHAGAFSVLEASGKLLRFDRTRRSSLSMLDTTYLEGGVERDWAGEPGNLTIDTLGVEWAVSIHHPHVAYIDAQPALFRGPHAQGPDRSPPSVWVTAERFRGPRGSRTSLLWRDVLPGTGCGAIASDGRVAVALRSGRFIVLDANRAAPGPDSKGLRLVDVPIDFAPRDLSIIGSGYAVLADGAAIENPAPWTEIERMIAQHARRIDPDGDGPLRRLRTIVHHLGPDGRETWKHELPFEVLQPPIDAGSGRIYLMGNGTAAVQDGKLLFATPSPTPMFGTAFEDGTMAVAAGAELRVVGPDGQVRQTFTTAAHEPITTPPAIGGDGSVWVGTEKAIYVAR